MGTVTYTSHASTSILYTVPYNIQKLLYTYIFIEYAILICLFLYSNISLDLSYIGTKSQSHENGT